LGGSDITGGYVALEVGKAKKEAEAQSALRIWLKAGAKIDNISGE